MNSTIEVRTTGRAGGVIVPRWRAEDPELDAYDFRVAVWLSTHTALYAERVSQRGICRRLGLSQGRVQKSLQRLSDLGLVTLEGEGFRGSLKVTFMVEAWEVNPQAPLTTRAVSAHDVSGDCSPGEHQENTGRNTRSTPRSAVDASFNAFWETYPKKTAKRTALLAYERAVRRVTAIDALNDQGHAIWKIRDAAARYASAMKGKDPQYVKAPTTWLNGDCWEDEAAIGGPIGRAMTRDETIEHDRQKLLREYNSVREF